MSRAGAHRYGVLCRWIDVIVHGYHHRDEYKRIVNEMQLDTRDPDLADARRHRAAEPVLMRLRLVKENEVLEVMPELNPERDHPPFVRSARKTLSQNPEPDEHHEGETVVQRLCLHEPRIVHAENSHRHLAGPVHHEELVRLDDVLEPVKKHDRQKNLKRHFVPARVQVLGETRGRVKIRERRHVWKTWVCFLPCARLKISRLFPFASTGVLRFEGSLRRNAGNARSDHPESAVSRANARLGDRRAHRADV